LLIRHSKYSAIVKNTLLLTAFSAILPTRYRLLRFFHPFKILLFQKTTDDALSRVHGFIHDDIFEGQVHCGDGNEYHVESAKQYRHLNHTSDIHSVIYNVKDIIPLNQHTCGGVKASATNGRMESQTNSTQGTFCFISIFLYMKAF